MWLFAILVGFVTLINGEEDDSEIVLHCPSDTFYAHIPLDDYQIDGSHGEHPDGTSYRWKLINKTPKESSILVYDRNKAMLKFDRIETATTFDFELKIKARVWISEVSEYETESIKCKVKVIFIEIPRFSIDLGTTFSCIAYRDLNEEIHIIELEEKEIGKKEWCIPTVIYFPENDDKIKFGYDALSYLSSDARNVIFDIKRIVGRRRDEKEVEQFIEAHQFTLTDDIYPKIIIPNRNNMEITPEQALSAILIYLVESASKAFDVPYSHDIVVSVPAFFHNGPRKGIRSACHLAGLNPRRLVVEPSAAALAYMDEANNANMNGVPFLTFDFGGGTLDCSIVRCQGLYDCHVIAVSGDPALGGIDFDKVIKNIIIEKLQDENVDIGSITQNDLAMIMRLAEVFKIGLSNQRCNNGCSFCEHIPIHNKPKVCVSKEEFENNEGTKRLIKRAIKTAQKVIDQFYESEGSLDFILLVGGTSHIPIIERELKKHFKNKALQIKHPIRNKQQLVVAGAAIIADRLDIPNSGITDVVPLSFGFAKCVGNPSENHMIDLVYVIDATGSMEPWIDQVKLDINKLISAMKAKFPEYSFRVGLVAYGDHGPTEHIKSKDFTQNIERFKGWLETMDMLSCGENCIGGGTEDVLGGLKRATELSWNADAALKLVIHVCDRPPHNKMYHNGAVGDEYPNGFKDKQNPHKSDPADYHKVVLNKFKEKGIVLMVAKLTGFLEIMIQKFKSYAKEIDMTIYDEQIQAALMLLPESERILFTAIGNIRSAETINAHNKNNENNSGKYECGLMDIIFKKNSYFNTSNSTQYCTDNPESTEAKIQVYEGDDEYVENNYLLLNITITNVPKGSCQTSTINVTFHIDMDGIATITAKLDDANNSDTECLGSCTRRLGVLSNDGALTDDQIIKYRKQMVNWFSSNAVQTVLNQ